MIFDTEGRPVVVEVRAGTTTSLVWEPAQGGVMTPTTLEPVPNQEKTPRKTFRIPPDLWEKAQVRAAERGETVTDVVIRALKRYVR